MDHLDSRVVRTVRSLRKMKAAVMESDSESTSTGSSTPLGGDSRPSTDQISQALALNQEFQAIALDTQLSIPDFVHIVQSDFRLIKSTS